jgi:hypothetical protein
MSDRHKTYQFMFAMATAHELTHLFVGYLAQGESYKPGSYTPPNVSYLNYGQEGSGGELPLGESGRFLESRLFGGSIEYYRDRQNFEDHEVKQSLIPSGLFRSNMLIHCMQFGVPHLLDQNAVSWKISSDSVKSLVEEPRRMWHHIPLNMASAPASL